jgi:hypothetical protein
MALSVMVLMKLTITIPLWTALSVMVLMKLAITIHRLGVVHLKRLLRPETTQTTRATRLLPVVVEEGTPAGLWSGRELRVGDESHLAWTT